MDRSHLHNKISNSQERKKTAKAKGEALEAAKVELETAVSAVKVRFTLKNPVEESVYNYITDYK